MKIAITTTSFGVHDDAPLAKLRAKNCEVVLNPYKRTITTQELIQLASDVEGLIAGTEPITEEALEQMRNLRVISRCGVGVDSIDVIAASTKGIAVLNTPQAPTVAVAELTVGFMIMLLRRVATMNQNIRQGIWNKMMGNLLCRKRVGIVGFGNIGKKVATLLGSFGVEIRYYDLSKSQVNPGCQFMDFDPLLQWADIITIHASSKNKKMILGAREFALMRQGAWLVNVSRGGLVDEDALYAAVANKHLAGAACDVFMQEPYTGPLARLDNIILTPHIGSYAVEARIAMEMQAVDNLLEVLEHNKSK